MIDFVVFSETRICTFFKGRIYFFVFSVFSVAHQILLTDRTGVTCFFLATQVPDKILIFRARHVRVKINVLKRRERHNGPLLSSV